MKRPLISLFASLLLISACLPLKPEIPGTETPAGPYLESLDRRRLSFTSLKALARAHAERKGKRRSYETVAVLLKGQQRMRIEAYDPLGRPFLTLLWNGGDVLLRLPDEREILNAGHSGIERLLGVAVEPAELCALLSGNIPKIPEGADTRVYCGPDGICILETRQEDTRRRALLTSGSGPLAEILPKGYDVYRGNSLAFSARFDYGAQAGEEERPPGYLLPMRIRLENPARKISLTLEYEDAEVNAPVDDGEFVLFAAGGEP